jgi:hypothetical protein
MGVDHAIALYRAELAADQSLGDATLDELTEHLRTAIDARLAAGDDEATAIETARRELGDPRVLARECARVRSSVGPRTPHVRAWGAAALSALWLWLAFWPGFGHVTPPVVVGSIVVVAALVARLPQTAAFLFGMVIAMIVGDLSSLLVWTNDGTWIPQGVDIPTTIVEIAMLVLLGWGYRPSRGAKVMIGLGAVCLVEWISDGPFGTHGLGTMGLWPMNGNVDAIVEQIVPMVLAVLCIGSVFRARWASWLAAVVAVWIVAGMVTETIGWVRYNTFEHGFLPPPPIGLYVSQAVAVAGAIVVAAYGPRMSRPLRMAFDDLRAGLA